MWVLLCGRWCIACAGAQVWANADNALGGLLYQTYTLVCACGGPPVVLAVCDKVAVACVRSADVSLLAYTPLLPLQNDFDTFSSEVGRACAGGYGVVCGCDL